MPWSGVDDVAAAKEDAGALAQTRERAWVQVATPWNQQDPGKKEGERPGGRLSLFSSRALALSPRYNKAGEMNNPGPMSAAPLTGHAYGGHFAARMLEFTADTAPWQRRLWGLGTVLSLRELYEAATLRC
jgi:hypothetical protein